ncbi:MAG: leucine-rich repeat domain-containing protein [bacterium]
MRIKFYLLSIGLCLSLSCLLMQEVAFGQKKSTGQATKDKAKVTDKDKAKPTASSIPEAEMELYRQQAEQIVQFLESTLNFLADKQNTVKEKETIINESYLKFFWDSEVQIEDDLDEKRLVPLYKDVQAYLTDVDFFFKGATFTYLVQDMNVLSNQSGQTFFKVTANRTLQGITVNGDSVNSNKVRYIEINYDGDKKQIKIVSIYTTKLNEKDDLRNWWNGLSEGWKEILGKDLKVDDGVLLSSVENYNDTVVVVEGMTIPITDSRIYGLFVRIVDSKSINLSGNPMISDLEPLTKLSALTSINLSNTPVTDLMPLRNLNLVENLDISGTQVISLDPLKYCNHIKELRLSKTPITDSSILESFPNLEVLDLSYTDIADLSPLKDLTKLKQLWINNTQVKDLAPLSGLTQLQNLDLSNTQVSSLEPLKSLSALESVTCNNTKVSLLQPLENLPALKRIYCDQTSVRKDKAVRFMLDYPGVVVIFASVELAAWWKLMSPEWQKIFYIYRNLDASPTREQLHSLMTIDSLNISGRTLVTTLAPLTELPQLWYLDCSLTSVNSLDPLQDLLNLKYINASSSQVNSVTSLSALVKLEYLNVDNTSVSDLSPLSNIQGLKLILADNTGVKPAGANAFIDKNPNCLLVFQTYENTNWWKLLPESWQAVFKGQLNLKKDPDKYQLQQIANLKSLTISENPQIISIQPATYLSQLETLVFSDTRITTLEPLSRMTWLKSLGFPKNAILDLTPLSGLTGLMELNFENTQVEDLQPIENLANLEVLKLSGTPVKNLKVLGRMMKLRVIELYNTKISNIDILDNMRNLQSVKIFNTKISSKKAEKFKAMHPGCEVVYY